MKIKDLLEGRHGYDDSGMSLSPGNDEGPDSWDYSAAHDRIGAGDPRRHRQYQHQVDVPHDVYINGRKWKTFGSQSHAINVAKKIKGATVHKAMTETTGDKPFDDIMKTISKGTKKQATVDKQEKRKETQQRTKDAISNMFGGGNPADKLGVRKNNVDESSGAQQAAIAIDKKKSGKYNKEGKRLKEDHDQGDRMDEMAMGELHNIASNAKKIYTMLKQGRQLDTWEYSYITTANDHLTTVVEVVATSELIESPSGGATGSGNVGISAVYPNKKPPKTPKNKDGTAKNALDMDANLLTGGSIKRA
jgi:hypothetical protein